MLDRRYTIARLQSFLDTVRRSERNVEYTSLYPSANSIAYAAFTILKYSPPIPRIVFHKKHVRDEIDCFEVRVSEISNIIYPSKKFEPKTSHSDLRDSKTSLTRHMRSFYREIESHASIFTPESMYISMIVLARYFRRNSLWQYYYSY